MVNWTINFCPILCPQFPCVKEKEKGRNFSILNSSNIGLVNMCILNLNVIKLWNSEIVFWSMEALQVYQILF